jgi:hypothetical protein
MYIYVYMCVYVCICVYIYICMYVYVYTYIYIFDDIIQFVLNMCHHNVRSLIPTETTHTHQTTKVQGRKQATSKIHLYLGGDRSLRLIHSHFNSSIEELRISLTLPLSCKPNSTPNGWLITTIVMTTRRADYQLSLQCYHFPFNCGGLC